MTMDSQLSQLISDTLIKGSFVDDQIKQEIKIN